MRRKGNIYSLPVGVYIRTFSIEICVEFPQKLEIDLMYDPAIQLLGIYPKHSIPYYRDTFSSKFMAALFTIARKCKESRCPSPEEWIMKE